MTDLFKDGWCTFAPEPVVSQWVAHALLSAKEALADPGNAAQYQCEGTWFVGLDALDNDAEGSVAGSGPLRGAAVDFVRTHIDGGWPSLHRAQVSGVFQGYPRVREGETEAGLRYRLKRDAAHVDGILGKGAPKRRFVGEPHAFIFGVPLTVADEGAAPLVVWQGSHEIMRAALRRAFAGQDPVHLSHVDVTEAYQAARRDVFARCPRVIVHGPPGSVLLLHRLVLHGVAPWQTNATAAGEGRLIAYFRPLMPGGIAAWIDAD